MLAVSHRPKKFSEMKGVVVPRRVLSAIARSPAEAPRSIILAGSWGSGKTSSTKIFARAVNCETRTGDSCNRCEWCTRAEGPPIYFELDSAIVGNVETVKVIRESLTYAVSDGYRVVVFDEIHLAGDKAQSALLKSLEEAPRGIFFLFATTNPEKLLPTIHSRSLYLEFEPISSDEIVRLLAEVAEKEKIGVTEQTLNYIARRSRGHARDALQQLELVRILGQEEYQKTEISLGDRFDRLLKFFRESNLGESKREIEQILATPLAFVEQDFEEYVKDLADRVYLQVQAVDVSVEKNIVASFLKTHRYLRTTNDWYVYLLSLKGLFEERKATSNTRFSK